MEEVRKGVVNTLGQSHALGADVICLTSGCKEATGQNSEIKSEQLVPQ